ncbi:transposase [Streptomyces glaucus]|uniref:Insertion element IS402-like domain-containing protein n=1 Tax=Streptomyces glaucus TaxID=284029 RepID=A0ABP5WBM9_9ACTN
MTQRPQTVSPLRRANTAGPSRQAQAPTIPGAGRFGWLAPMVLWPLARRHLPRPAVRPQGGGTQRADDEAMFAAIVYVLVSGVPWRALPKTFAVSWQNTHRRFTQWSGAGLWDRLRDTARRQQMPGHLQQWADTVAALAEERLNRTMTTAPAPAPAGAAPSRAAGRPGGGLKPGIRLHEQGDFTVRLFGPDHGPAEQQVTDQELRRAR